MKKVWCIRKAIPDASETGRVRFEQLTLQLFNKKNQFIFEFSF